MITPSYFICLFISCWPRFVTLYKPVGDDLHTSACLWTLIFGTSCLDSISEFAIAAVWPSRMPATSSGQPIWNNLWLKMSHQSRQDLVKFCRILGEALNWVSLSNRMPTRAWGILMDFNGFYPSLLAAFLRWFSPFLRLNMSSSFHVISCHFSFFLLVVRLRAPLQELGQVHWKFQLVPLTHCGRTLNVFSHLCSTAYWLHVAQRSASWLVGKAPVQGLRSEWELDDDRLQCFNIYI